MLVWPIGGLVDIYPDDKYRSKDLFCIPQSPTLTSYCLESVGELVDAFHDLTHQLWLLAVTDQQQDCVMYIFVVLDDHWADSIKSLCEYVEQRVF